MSSDPADDQSMPYPERPDIYVKPPSDDPRWDNPQVVQWRKDAALLRQNVMPVVLETNGASLVQFLGVLGFTEITEDLMYVFWVSLPIFYRFASSRIAVVCHHPEMCGSSAINHMDDGLTFVGAHLLHIEDNYMGKAI